MILNIGSGTACIFAPGVRSRVAGYFQLNSNCLHPTSINASILIERKPIRHVVASSIEAETVGDFHSAQRPVPTLCMLTKLGYPQPPNSIKK